MTLHRRALLRVGALSAGGLSLASVLAARQAQAASERKNTSVILFWMAGGPSQLETYDPKPQAPAEVRGPFSPLATCTPGLEVCDLLPRHAPLADRFSIVRSITHSLSIHDDGSHWMQTGYPLFNARERGQQQPCQGSVVSALRGPNAEGLPAYVCIPEDYRTHLGFFQGAAFLGARHNAVNAGSDSGLHPYKPPELSLPEELTVERLTSRRALSQQLDALAAQVERSAETHLRAETQSQAFDLLTGPRARAAFNWQAEPDAVKERYGAHHWGQAALLARRLVEAGVTFVTINLYDKDIDWWDDHTKLEPNLRNRLPPYDQALCVLLEDLSERGLLDETLVVACGEFGRTPKIGATSAGRDHWPRAMSVLLAGGGIRGGQVIGSTTKDAGEPADLPLPPGALLATIYRVLGIPHETILHDRQNRPTPLVPEGQPIAGLFA